MAVTIEQDEVGIYFRDGIYKKFLLPGKHTLPFFGKKLVELHKVGQEFKSSKSLEILVKDEKLTKLLDIVDVADHQIALHFADGHFQKILKPGKTAFWNLLRKNTFEVIDFSKPDIPAEIHPSILAHAETVPHLQAVSVASFQKALLFFNGKFQRVLEPGKYHFWNGPTKVTAELVDLRQQQLDMTGQEIMTQDKVTLRLNFICLYRIVDPLTVFQNIKEYEKQLYIQLQLILREYVGMLKLDELLEKKEEVGQFILEKLKKNAGSWGIEFVGAGVKDVILPGEIKDILNKVIEAEKRAQANVITRREETASTRSLLNTVKLMEDNPLLVKLKEWEQIETIATKISSISVSSGADILQQLGKILTPQK
jgi:regulator of protease activity HflC (stomatin/prohibitin superfamily)